MKTAVFSWKPNQNRLTSGWAKPLQHWNILSK